MVRRRSPHTFILDLYPASPHTTVSLLQLTSAHKQEVEEVLSSCRDPLCRRGLKERMWYVSVSSHHDHLSAYIIIIIDAALRL